MHNSVQFAESAILVVFSLVIFIVSEAAVCGEAEELEMQTERYIQDLQQALTGTEKSANYSFVLTPSPPDSSSTITLAYEKVQRDISVSISSVIPPIPASVMCDG